MRAWILVALAAAFAATDCQPSPCQQLVAAWKQCWCDGATTSTTRSQETIDRTCASDQAFLTPPDTPVPEPERAAIARCADADAEWASGRMQNSECRAGGSYVCGSEKGDDVCTPPG